MNRVDLEPKALPEPLGWLVEPAPFGTTIFVPFPQRYDRDRLMKQGGRVTPVWGYPLALTTPPVPASSEQPVATMHRSESETLFSKGWVPDLMGFASKPLYLHPASLPSRVSADRAAVIEECARVADEMRLKHSSPTGDAYSCGVWDQGVRIAAAIRSLAPTPPASMPEAEGWWMVPREPTPEMLKAGMDDLGWWVEPYEAPRESGVPTECDISAEDAARINSQQIEVVGSAYRAMLAAAPPLPAKGQ